MFKRIITATVIALGLSGCQGVFTGLEYKPDNVKEIYSKYKEIYRDAKYVVHEINTEKNRVKTEGFTVK
jgi:hypothetical protein